MAVTTMKGSEIGIDAGLDVKYASRWYTPVALSRASHADDLPHERHLRIVTGRDARRAMRSIIIFDDDDYPVRSTPGLPCLCPAAKREYFSGCRCGLTAREYQIWDEATDGAGYAGIATCQACGSEWHLRFGEDMRTCPGCGSRRLIHGGC